MCFCQDYYGYYMGVAEKSNGDFITVCRTNPMKTWIYWQGLELDFDSLGNRKWDVITRVGNQGEYFHKAYN